MVLVAWSRKPRKSGDKFSVELHYPDMQWRGYVYLVSFILILV